MRNARRAVLISSMALCAMVGPTAVTANADNWQTAATTCSGGDLPSGVYEGLVITGECPSLLAQTVTTQTVTVPSAAAATAVLFAFAAGGAPATQTSCPASSVVPARCSLALALSLAGPGDTVAARHARWRIPG
jgi:hypothetical protein